MKNLCCSPSTDQCQLQGCKSCPENIITCNEFTDKITFYDLWESVKEETTGHRSGKKVVYIRVIKQRNRCMTHELVDKYVKLLQKYVLHLARIINQHKGMIS